MLRFWHLLEFSIIRRHVGKSSSGIGGRPPISSKTSLTDNISHQLLRLQSIGYFDSLVDLDNYSKDSNKKFIGDCESV